MRIVSPTTKMETLVDLFIENGPKEVRHFHVVFKNNLMTFIAWLEDRQQCTKYSQFFKLNEDVIIRYQGYCKKSNGGAASFSRAAQFFQWCRLELTTLTNQVQETARSQKLAKDTVEDSKSSPAVALPVAAPKVIAQKAKSEKKIDQKPKAEKKIDQKPKAEKKIDQKPKAEKKIDQKPKAEKKIVPHMVAVSEAVIAGSEVHVWFPSTKIIPLISEAEGLRTDVLKAAIEFLAPQYVRRAKLQYGELLEIAADGISALVAKARSI